MSIKEDFIYAVARIRIREGKLLSSKNIEQIISLEDTQSILRYLSENGWSVGQNYTDVLLSEEKALWSFMKDLVEDISYFDFLRVQNDFYNLKVSIKSVYSDCEPTPMFVEGCINDPAEIYKAVAKKEYAKLPEDFITPAQEAMTILLRSGDGQLCDIVLDRACLLHVAELGKKNRNKIIKEYCEIFVAFSDIRIAVRGLRFHKSSGFILRSMARCDSININKLSVAASKSIDEICSYLLTTNYKDSVNAMQESLTTFEKWCDNYIMNKLRSYKSDSFTIGPLVAYIIAKETEIKTVRLILTAKANDINDEVIRERVREMYV